MTGVVPQGRESLALTLAAGIESLGLGLAEVRAQHAIESLIQRRKSHGSAS